MLCIAENSETKLKHGGHVGFHCFKNKCNPCLLQKRNGYKQWKLERLLTTIDFSIWIYVLHVRIQKVSDIYIYIPVVYINIECIFYEDFFFLVRDSIENNWLIFSLF